MIGWPGFTSIWAAMRPRRVCSCVPPRRRPTARHARVHLHAQAVFDRAGKTDEGHALLGQSRQQTREAMNQGGALLRAGKLDEALKRIRAACTLSHAILPNHGRRQWTQPKPSPLGRFLSATPSFGLCAKGSLGALRQQHNRDKHQHTAEPLADSDRFAQQGHAQAHCDHGLQR